MGKDTFTAKQRAFIQEYLVDLNGTQAAIRAGYKAKTAAQIATENLKKPNIQRAIQKAMDERAERTKVTQDRIIFELAKLAFANMKDFATWGPGGIKIKNSNELSAIDTACVAELSETVTEHGGTVRFKLHDKKQALELLGRHLKLFTDKLDLSIDDGLADLPTKQLLIKAAELMAEMQAGPAKPGKPAKAKKAKGKKGD